MHAASLDTERMATLMAILGDGQEHSTAEIQDESVRRGRRICSVSAATAEARQNLRALGKSIACRQDNRVWKYRIVEMAG